MKEDANQNYKTTSSVRRLSNNKTSCRTTNADLDGVGPDNDDDDVTKTMLQSIDQIEGRIRDLAATQARPETERLRQRKPLMVWVTLFVIFLWNWPIFVNLYVLLTEEGGRRAQESDKLSRR